MNVNTTINSIQDYQFSDVDNNEEDKYTDKDTNVHTNVDTNVDIDGDIPPYTHGLTPSEQK